MDLRVFCLRTFGEEESFVDRNPKERDHVEDLDIERRTTLEWILTLRRLMSYIYIYIYMEHPFLMFLDHTQRRSTVGRTPLDERSARRRDLYLTTT